MVAYRIKFKTNGSAPKARQMNIPTMKTTRQAGNSLISQVHTA